MNISYNWLKDLVEINLPPPELAQKLTDAGLAVEGIKEFGDDFVFDIDVTSNRSDCLSHLGIAREIAAITHCKLQTANCEDHKPPSENSNLVAIQDADFCPRLTAHIIRGVKIHASPEWLVKRLAAVGERSINNVADITNFVMHELGNPMHSFDLNKLTGNRIVVRRARPGETIKTLDETERRLDETMLAICDAEKPVAVAGIMGGFDTSITVETTDVLLEVACFKRENIRQTSRRLKLSTEASHRFERGVDIENLIRASNRATDLICKLAGGTAEEFADVYPVTFVPNEIESKDIRQAVKRLTGLDVEKPKILEILAALGISQKSETIFLSPSWRHDLAIEEDLVEEIARIVGYDKIGEELPPSSAAGEYQPSEIRKFHLRQALATLGFDEAISYSFIDSKTDEIFELIPQFANESLDEKFVTLQDSIIEGAARMRPTLLPGLLAAVRANFNQQQKNLRLFEIGKVFSAGVENNLPNERELLALIVTGSETFQNKASATRELDFYDAKGALETALDAINSPPPVFAAKNIKHLRRGQSAEMSVGGKTIGTIGRLNDEIAADYKFRQPIFVAEIDLQTLLAIPEQNIFYRPLPVYPAVERDISLLVKRSTSFSDIQTAVAAENFELLRSLEFVDVYEGKGVADDERSLTVRLKYRSRERTLIEQQVEKIHGRVLQMLESKLNAKLRF